jgi:uncharacterized PurR-regulated membrane protein YhhQ (DUF165 family)
MTIPHDDRWLLPRRQSEVPGWDLVAEETLHARREATFLWLSALFVGTSVVLVALGTSRIVDPAPVLAVLAPGVALPLALRIPFGVLPFALGALALTLVCELYGRRRAAVLVAVGLVVTIGVGALLRLADRIDGTDASFAPTLAFAGCYLVGHGLYVPLFDALRRRMAGHHLWLRLLVLSSATQLAGWSAFGFALYGLATMTGGPVDVPAISALATGAGLYSFACIVVLTLPVALLARALRLFLRVARPARNDIRSELAAWRSGPEAGPLGPMTPGHRRPVRPSLQPFSSAEMRFFAEGDQLAES